MIGLAGSHRSGKSTLARAFAEKHGVPFVQTSALAVFEEMGLDPAKTYDFDTRLRVQEEILVRFDKLYAEYACVELAIADRTPLDLASYLLGDVSNETLNESQEERLGKYVSECFAVCNKRFSIVLVVQPGIEVVPMKGKASASLGYREHLNSLVLGFSVDERLLSSHFYIPRTMLNLDERVGAVEYAVQRSRERALSQRQALGISVH